MSEIINIDKERAARLLDRAAQICVSSHVGQRDKTGEAYFQHPMRVAMRCRTVEEKIVALLHDVIEDTSVTADYLVMQGLPQYIVEAILSVTKRDGENYEAFVARAGLNPIGRIVKIHDLEDNLDALRLVELDAAMASRFNRYLRAYRSLMEK